MKPYYDEAGITIFHGDCREVLPTLPKCDLLLTDPPYGVNLGTHKAANETRGWLAKKAYKTYDDTPENFLSVVVPAIETSLLLVRNGMVFTSGTGLAKLPEYKAVGGVFLPSGVGRTCWGFQNFSFLALYGNAPSLNLGAKPTGIVSTATSGESEHPCPKPIEWMKWAIQLGSLPTDTVLDPFMGSGTTLRAAKDLGLKAIGIEIEERYCEIAANRLRQGVLFPAVQE